MIVTYDSVPKDYNHGKNVLEHLSQFSSLLFHWCAEFECWYFIFFVHRGQAFMATTFLPFPHQTMLRDVAYDLTTWSQSTLYKGGRGMILMVVKCPNTFTKIVGPGKIV